MDATLQRTMTFNAPAKRYSWQMLPLCLKF